MTEKTDHPGATHNSFPYFFANAGLEDPPEWKVDGIHFGMEIEIIIPNFNPIWINDLAIFYGDSLNTDYLDVRCSRWDVDNYSHTVECWINKTELYNLLDNIRPGAVGELYNILGKPRYYDKSWTGKNTIRLYPTPSSQQMNMSNLKYMRDEKIIYVKNISQHPIKNTQFIELKIEGYVSGNTL